MWIYAARHNVLTACVNSVSIWGDIQIKTHGLYYSIGTIYIRPVRLIMSNDGSAFYQN